LAGDVVENKLQHEVGSLNDGVNGADLDPHGQIEQDNKQIPWHWHLVT